MLQNEKQNNNAEFHMKEVQCIQAEVYSFTYLNYFLSPLFLNFLIGCEYIGSLGLPNRIFVLQLTIFFNGTDWLFLVAFYILVYLPAKSLALQWAMSP